MGWFSWVVGDEAIQALFGSIALEHAGSGVPWLFRRVLDSRVSASDRVWFPVLAAHRRNVRDAGLIWGSSIFAEPVVALWAYLLFFVRFAQTNLMFAFSMKAADVRASANVQSDKQ